MGSFQATINFFIIIIIFKYTHILRLQVLFYAVCIYSELFGSLKAMWWPDTDNVS